MDDLAFGLQIAVVGMAIVFGVLVGLWLLLTLVARLEGRGPGRPAPVVEPAVVLETDAREVDQRLVAAIGIAVLAHAEALRRQAAPAMRSYWPGSLLFASRWVAAGRTRQGQSWRRRR